MTAKQIARILLQAFKEGNKLLICGNGGSYDLANHMEEELVCKFTKIRRAFPALALKAHTSTSNDFGYEHVFARQIQAYGKEGDVLIGISTSGKSLNVNLALETARKMGLLAIDFPRRGNSTDKIQEYQLKLMHDICRIVEKAFV